ncbi:MAG: hypothetical protein S4CHLAM7_10890 [Chlamydiae bacterium]|nr:hypothetical protein [Chlamydiota bacterium]
MKFIHAADVHLDSFSSSLRTFYGSKSLSIAEEVKNSFVSLIDLALYEDVDFVLLVGDVFDANWRDYGIGLFFLKQVKRLKCPVYYLRGNHDAENRLLKKLSFPKNIIEIPTDKAQTYIIENLKVAIHGQSYAEYHTEEDLSQNYPKGVPGYYNIGLLHTSGDVKLGETPYAPYISKILKDKRYQYWALGHLHDFQILDENPYIVYPGNVQGRHIRETGSKGCCVVTTDRLDTIEIKFHGLSRLIWDRLTLDISSAFNERELKKILVSRVKKHIANYSETDLRFILRFNIEGICNLRESLSDNLEHFEHQVFCWLDEEFSGFVYLEKLINRSISSQTLKEDFALLDDFVNSIESSMLSGDVETYFNEVIKSLKERSPEALRRSSFYSDLQSNFNLQEQIQRVKDRVKKNLFEDRK